MNISFCLNSYLLSRKAMLSCFFFTLKYLFQLLENRKFDFTFNGSADIGISHTNTDDCFLTERRKYFYLYFLIILHITISLGNTCRIWQVGKVAVNLPTLAGVRPCWQPADLGRLTAAFRIHQICVNNLLTLAGLRPVFGYYIQSVNNLPTLAGLRPLFPPAMYGRCSQV